MKRNLILIILLTFVILVILFSGCSSIDNNFGQGKEVSRPFGSEYMGYRKKCNDLGGKLPVRCNDVELR